LAKYKPGSTTVLWAQVMASYKPGSTTVPQRTVVEPGLYLREKKVVDSIA
jgi:hypothetical protein